MKIYTKTGDKGKTSLFGGKRVFKFHPRIETYGTIDELNSILGVALSYMPQSYKKQRTELEAIQSDLFAIGAYLANPSAAALSYLPQRISYFEKEIDMQTNKLPALRNFIIPGGGKAGASLHHARTVCRRVERNLVALSQDETLDEQVLIYLNRLSDLLFSTARFINYKEKKKETLWKGT